MYSFVAEYVREKEYPGKQMAKFTRYALLGEHAYSALAFKRHLLDARMAMAGCYNGYSDHVNCYLYFIQIERLQ